MKAIREYFARETEGKFAWQILLLLLLAQLAMAAGAYAWGPLGPFLVADLALSLTQVGSLASGFFLGSVAIGIPAGLLVDRHGARSVLIASLITMGTGFVLIGLSRSYYLIAGLAILSGLGYGTINQVAAKSIVSWFTARSRSTVMGIRVSGVTIGGALAALVIPWLSRAYGWPFAALIMGILIALTTLLVITFFRDRTAVNDGGVESGKEDLSAKRAGKRQLKKVLTQRQLMLPIAISPFLAGSQVCLTTFFILYLHEQVFPNGTAVGIFLTIVMIAGTLGRIGWGTFSDLLLAGNRMKTLIIIAAVGFCGSLLNLLLPALRSPLVTGVTAVLLGVSLLGWHGLVLAYIAELGGKEFAGTVTGVSITVSWTGMLFMPPLFGYITDRFGYLWSWQLVLVPMAMAVIFFALLNFREQHRGVEVHQ